MKRFYFAVLVWGCCLISGTANTLGSEKTFSEDTTLEQLKVEKNGVITISSGVKLILQKTSTVAGTLILKPGAQIEF